MVMSPLMCTRRIGAAWETAQRVVPPSGVTDRFSALRQKFWVAFFSSPATQPASTLMLRVMFTSSGFLPKPTSEV